MHITLTGNLGSGKSTISKIFANKYGYEIYSTGKVIREFAAERGLSVLEMNQLMEKDNSFDHLIDEDPGFFTGVAGRYRSSARRTFSLTRGWHGILR